MKGIVLFGHGARNPEWAEPFHRIRAAMFVRDPDAMVELGFLEAMQPTLDQAIDALVARGARRIAIVPIFIAILMTILIQATSTRWLARRLGLLTNEEVI